MRFLFSAPIIYYFINVLSKVSFFLILQNEIVDSIERNKDNWGEYHKINHMIMFFISCFVVGISCSLLVNEYTNKNIINESINYVSIFKRDFRCKNKSCMLNMIFNSCVVYPSICNQWRNIIIGYNSIQFNIYCFA